ncbi:hypothetical protein BC008_28760 [Mastigocoleus testarum BC008]|uniref:Uncharacterized protein n=1 Tax=Mastigocoleus testarum BC008 TaxID=371196 RepID=A0A0V7ZR52_9CYAN|nr:hypothetical protein BC008_27415 [Mastigocoleus testarum BC008]KST67188.1 hypothetical protein BC008_28760 [Mastigocoleus testarum BC008]
MPLMIFSLSVAYDASDTHCSSQLLKKNKLQKNKLQKNKLQKNKLSKHIMTEHPVEYLLDYGCSRESGWV